MTKDPSRIDRRQRRGWTFQLHNVKSDVGPISLQSVDSAGTGNSDPPASEAENTPGNSIRSSWTYSAPTIVEWSLHSDVLLSITYRSKGQGQPEYTNISPASDYVYRGLTCSSGGRDEHDDTGACFGGGGRCCKAYSRCLQRVGIGPRPVEIHKEVYTSADVVRTELLEDSVAIRGFSSCSCLRVHLKPKVEKRERFGDEPTCNFETAPGVSSSSVTLQGDDHRQYLGGESTTDDFISSDFTPADNLTGDEPWAKRTSEDERSHLYGPILTFAIMEQESNYLKDCPPLLWKVSIPPDPTICVETLTVLEGILEVDDAPFSLDESGISSREPTEVYINGYQSWSYSGTVGRGHSQPSSAMPHILSRAFNRGATVPPRPRRSEPILPTRIDRNHRTSVDDIEPLIDTQNAYSDTDHVGSQNELDDDDIEKHFYKSDLYACVTSQSRVNERPPGDETSDFLASNTGPALILGSLSQRRQFSLVTLCPDLRDVSIQCSLDGAIPSRSEGIVSDWSYAQIMHDECYDEEPTIHYINAVASHNNARPLRHGILLTGWCSWYHYYENIEESMLRQTFDTLGSIRNKMPSNVALIDDGYMTAWGDWGSLKPDAFPTAFRLGPKPTDREVDSCMQGLARSIRSNGMKPGIWVAPFAADKHSELVKANPEWIIRDASGRPANSSNCGKFFYGLDATNPHVREHAFNILRRATTVWGFECLKLDFLYAAVLKGNGKYDLSMSRAEGMDLALRCLRAGAGPATFIIGCGCPLGNAVGYIDGMRISADTGPTWYPAFPLPSWDNSTLPSLRAMMRNSITRSNLGHRWWHNDPDCILLGETTELTDEEILSAVTVVAMTGGMMLMSDDLTKLRHTRFRIITRIFPLTGASAVALDLHRPSKIGIPCLLRLWCTDESRVDMNESVRGSVTTDDEKDEKTYDHTELSIQTSRAAAFFPDRSPSNPFLRIRNCVRVAEGLGKWSVVSVSNWSDIPMTVSEPLSTFLPPTSRDSVDTSSSSKLGFHVLAFWGSKYSWIPHQRGGKQRTLGKRLDPHETEIFHVKPVRDEPQYIGSDIHFTCGHEVRFFRASDCWLELGLNNYCRRSGYIFVFLPKCGDGIKATVNGKCGHFELVSTISPDGDGPPGKVLRLWVTVRGDGSDNDGLISMVF